MTWLPQADLIALMDLDTKQHFTVPWVNFFDVAGDQLEKLPYVLPRFLVKSHPDEAQLQRLRKVAI